jgi:Kinase associated domain 1/Adenylate sensor of SNF1-like protein kinase
MHSWFQQNLPPYLRQSPDLIEKQERVIDQGVIEIMMSLPFDKAYGTCALHQNVIPAVLTRELVEKALSPKDYRVSDAPKLWKDLRCAYELILDEKYTQMHVTDVASAAPPAFSPGGCKSTTPGVQYSSGSSSHYPHNLDATGLSNSLDASRNSYSHSPTLHRAAPSVQVRLSEDMTRALIYPGGIIDGRQSQHDAFSVQSSPWTLGAPHLTEQPITSSIPGNTGVIAQYQKKRQARKWFLGIQSIREPFHVMTEVYKVLKILGCEWLQSSPYRIKCKWRPHAYRSSPPQPNSNSGGRVVGNPMEILSEKEGEVERIPNLSTVDYSIKIGLALYKVQQNVYLLDFQRMTGDAFSYMTLCANIIKELKRLSEATKQQTAQQRVEIRPAS